MSSRVHEEIEYRVTCVAPTPALRELRALVARALPSLAWRHHAIGVLQAYLTERDPEVRVHIWHPELMRVGAEEEGRVHDHRFTLRSAVLLGAVGHDEFHVSPDADGAYQRFEVINARRQGGADHPTPLPGAWAAEIVTGKVAAGNTYTFPEGRFHRSHVNGLAVTLVTKLDQRDRRAQLLVPRGRQPRHGFADNGTVDIAHYVQLAAFALGELL